MVDSNAPSDTVLDELPARALKFLTAVSTSPTIRTVLAQRGYQDADHEKGWELVLKASGYKRPAAPGLPQSDAAKAIAELDAWDEPHFRIARASLREFPEQRDFVFADLEPQTGAGAVVSITTFLDRLDELRHGKDRKATRKADHAALAKLETRGIGADERARLRGLLKIATASPERAAVAPKGTAATAAAAAAMEEELRQTRLALWAFYSEWSEIARADIKRRDYLIRLGLAKRKTPAKKPEAEDK